MTLPPYPRGNRYRDVTRTVTRYLSSLHGNKDELPFSCPHTRSHVVLTYRCAIGTKPTAEVRSIDAYDEPLCDKYTTAGVELLFTNPPTG